MYNSGDLYKARCIRLSLKKKEDVFIAQFLLLCFIYYIQYAKINIYKNTPL